MSTSLLNFDTSFFTVEIDGVEGLTKAQKYLTDKIISFEIVEEMGKMMHGVISLFEYDDFRISKVLKKGTKIKVTWGYKDKNILQKDLYAKTENPKELMTSGMLSRFAQGYITNPSWNADNQGKILYNCNFVCYENSWMSKGHKTYKGTTKSGVVADVLKEMGVTQSFVKFRAGKDKVSGDTSIRRDNCSLFRFLHEKGLEWRCLFRIAYDGKTKSPIALFCDYDDDTTIETFVNKFQNCTGASILWEYKSGKNNVMSYTMQYNAAEGGTGDNVRMVMVNGQPQFYRTVAKTEGVEYYKLNTDKMTKEMREAGDVSAQVQLLDKWMSASKWDDIKKYFSKVDSRTAPQGIGMTLNIEAIGDPLCTASARAKFKKGFPDATRMKGIIFYMTSVTHHIDNAGYKNSIQIADSFSVSGGSLVG